MATMLLFTIGIDEVRDLFGAGPDLAARLRTLSAPFLSSGEPDHHGSRRARRARRPASPPHAAASTRALDTAELEELIAGRYVEPGRLGAAWQMVTVWLDDLSWDRARLDATPEQLSDWDFQLAVAGLASEFGLARLEGRDAQIPLLPGRGLRVGYVHRNHVLASWRHIEQCLPALEENTRTAIAPVTELLGRFGQWTAAAHAEGRPEPDLFTLRWQVEPDRP
ncbi:MAG: hypothetical protein WAX29_09140 [Propionibacterium sp.]